MMTPSEVFLIMSSSIGERPIIPGTGDRNLSMETPTEISYYWLTVWISLSEKMGTLNHWREMGGMMELSWELKAWKSSAHLGPWAFWANCSQCDSSQWWVIPEDHFLGWTGWCWETVFFPVKCDEGGWEAGMWSVAVFQKLSRSRRTAVEAGAGSDL